MSKYFALFLLSCAIGTAADDYATDQAARVVIGQPNFTAQDVLLTTNQYQLGAVGGVAYANNTLFVVDSNRLTGATPQDNRVLIYDNVSSFVPAPNAEIKQGVRCPVCIGGPETRGADVVLGQSNFTTTTAGLSTTAFTTPTNVATNGQILVVSDTDNNRVLIWKTIPHSNNKAPDLVLGQPDFNTLAEPPVTNQTSLRGPQGVWIQGTRLFVADTQNNRIMVWNSIPTSNNQQADYFIGVPNFTTPPSNTATPSPTASNMWDPVSVTSDGAHLFVTDLGFNRVLIWNGVPTQNRAADVVLGQPNMTSGTQNNNSALCPQAGTDSSGNPYFPARCGFTLSFPRYALSDGTRLYIADGGNDRVLIYNTIPVASAAKANVVLGQTDEYAQGQTDNVDDPTQESNITRSAADAIRSPMALAFDGTNLYVTDPWDRRVLVFTPGEKDINTDGIVNAASGTVYAIGSITVGGTIQANDVGTVTINTATYTYTVVKADTLATVVQNLTNKINAGPDPNVIAIADTSTDQIALIARKGGSSGDNIAYSATVSTNAVLTLTTAYTTLLNGQNADELVPGSLITIHGVDLSDQTASADPTKQLPTSLGGVQFYVDGITVPLIFVSPTQINAQLPFELTDTTSSSGFLLIHRNDGTVVNTTAENIPVVLQNPGIFAQTGVSDPRPVLAYHSSSNATASILVTGTIAAGNTATVTIGTNSYTYTVEASDTLDTVRDALIREINSNGNEIVTAAPSGEYDYVVLTAKAPGPEGNGIPIAGTVSSDAVVTLTALQSATCCSNTAGAPVTQDNPAQAGEIITIYATGLGTIVNSGETVTGKPYSGPQPTVLSVPVDDAELGGKTASVLEAGLVSGMVGMYEVKLQLDPSVATDPNTQLFIAQSIYTSNIVSIPVVNPNPTTETTSTSSAVKAPSPDARQKGSAGITPPASKWFVRKDAGSQ